MQPNQILSASLLDILFEHRNKNYGAYELRATYPKRVIYSLLLATTIAGGALMLVGSTTSSDSTDISLLDKPEVYVEAYIEPIPPPEPPPARPAEPPQVRTVAHVNIQIVPNELATDPPPTQDELRTAQVGLQKLDGVDFDNTPQAPVLEGTGRGIVEAQRVADEPVIHQVVSAEAQFPGGIDEWLKFLQRNCDGQVASDNGAPEGRHTVIIRFVVDEEGNVSDLVPTTKIGFGMEQEALRVLRKAAKKKWIPAVQNGRPVKAYRSQPITFEVLGT
jgi:protein TonB